MKINIILIIIMMFTSCNQKVSKNKEIININVDEAEIDTKTPYSDIFESVELVQLKQTNHISIGKIHDLKLIGDTLFIFDRMFAKCLFLYTREGEFINKVGAIGKGPGEYISPSSFFIDHANRAIYISDSHLHKVFKYNYDGTFLKEIRTGIRCESIFVSPNKDIFIDVAIRNGEKYLFKSINEETLKEENYLKFPQDNKGWDINAILNKNKFFPFGNSVLYYNYSSDIIYQISNKSVSPFIAINSNNPLTAKELSNVSKDVAIFEESLYELNSEGKYFGIYNFLMNDLMVYMNIDYQRRSMDLFYSIQQNKIIGQNLVDDITHIPSRFFLDVYEDKMLRVLPAGYFDFEEYKENLKSGKLPVPSNYLESIQSIDNIHDNPIILLYKIKESV
jgi:hypothetical protein